MTRAPRLPQLAFAGFGTIMALVFLGAVLTGLGFAATGLLRWSGQTHGLGREIAGLAIYSGLTLGFAGLFAVPAIPIAAMAYWLGQRRFGPSLTLALAIGILTALGTLLLLTGMRTGGRELWGMGAMAVPIGMISGGLFHTFLKEITRTS